MRKALLGIMLLISVYQVAKPITADNSTVVGVWKCAVIDAPSQYSNSTITFIEKDGKLTGSVKFDSGEEIKLSTIKYTSPQLILTLYVEGNTITVDGKVAGEKITGTVDTPDGKINFTANKVVEKKK